MYILIVNQKYFIELAYSTDAIALAKRLYTHADVNFQLVTVDTNFCHVRTHDEIIKAFDDDKSSLSKIIENPIEAF